MNNENKIKEQKYTKKTTELVWGEKSNNEKARS